MKNILYRLTFAVLVATSFASCVTVEDDFDDNRPGQNVVTHFNPPRWIQGKWILAVIQGEHHLLEFKTNNFLEVFPEMHLEKDYNADINQRINELNQPTLVTETTINDSIYGYNIDYSPETNPSNSKVTYKFTKISENKIQLQFLHEDGEPWGTTLLDRYTR